MSEMGNGPRTRNDEASTEISALAELALCETLSQTSGWAARWSAALSGADGALLWAPHSLHPLFLCIGAWGEGTERMLRRSVPRESGIVKELVSGRAVIRIPTSELAKTEDPWLKGVPGSMGMCLAVPVEAEGIVVGLLALLFREPPDADQALAKMQVFVQYAAPALGRALRADRKTVGMLRAIERLTNLYDLSKAFGSTIDFGELAQIIVAKAADFSGAEVASLWVLDRGDVVLAATAANENFEVERVPVAVGASIVAQIVTDQAVLRGQRLPDDDPLRTADPSYPVDSLLALPLVDEFAPVGALIVANKRGRIPEFGSADEELLQDLARQAVRALRNARLYEAEKKVAELDALLTVSREITATLDLDKVMKTVVNASSALVPYDRCAIGIMRKGQLRVGAISGMASLERTEPSVRRTEELLQWVFYGGEDVAVEQTEDGRIVADRPETEEKFRVFFRESGMNAYYGLLLKDEEGKLGVLAFESREPLLIDEERRDLVQILVNQATVAVRNAQLYQQVPLAGFWKPLLERRRRLGEIPLKRRRAWVVAAAVTLVLLVAVPWPIRVAGPTRILPGRRVAVTAEVEGVIKSVERREGDTVRPGDVIAVLWEDDYEAALAHADAAFQIAESNVARYRHENDAGAMFQALAQRDEFALRVALARENISRARLKAPAAGVIVTPHLEERVGQFLAKGTELCVLADVATVTAEVAVPEADASLLKAGQRVALKLNPYPTRVFRGAVTRIGAEIHQEGEERFVIAESQVENPDGLLKAGMAGRGKVVTGTRSLAFALARKPARYFWTKLWPVLP